MELFRSDKAEVKRAGGAALQEVSLITAGTKIIGNVTGTGSMELLGTITGNVDITGTLDISGSMEGDASAGSVNVISAQVNGKVKGQGDVEIGEGSVIIGDVSAGNATVAGAVKGDFDVQESVILERSAVVMGNIKSKVIQVDNGAVLEGRCSQCYAEVSPSAYFDQQKNM